MALVDYASDEEENDSNTNINNSHPPHKNDRSNDNRDRQIQASPDHHHPLKRKRVDAGAPLSLPPLPSGFHNLYASSTRVSTGDDPNLHDGRIRITPHIEGNWPSHVQIEWHPTAREYELLSEVIAVIADKAAARINVKTLLTSELGAPLPLHISLSRSMGLATEIKDQFLVSIKAYITASRVRPFFITFAGLRWVQNVEGLRWFLVLRLAKPENDGLNRLLNACNAAAQEFRQPPLYAGSAAKTLPRKASVHSSKKLRNEVMAEHATDQSDSFHISIAWCLTAPSAEDIKAVENTFDNTSHLQSIRHLSFLVDEIKAKIGNIVTSISLRPDIPEEKRSLGF
ncbi:MAG: poly(U)-specific 3'-to-5' RNA exonuclease [Claussenomyces sp. TS43310]|nr:MAG: poly(U)-specific 3'-to-5' RNA exonuclease [Claussenomyces sp. TS43310]